MVRNERSDDYRAMMTAREIAKPTSELRDLHWIRADVSSMLGQVQYPPEGPLTYAEIKDLTSYSLGSKISVLARWNGVTPQRMSQRIKRADQKLRQWIEANS